MKLNRLLFALMIFLPLIIGCERSGGDYRVVEKKSPEKVARAVSSEPVTMPADDPHAGLDMSQMKGSTTMGSPTAGDMQAMGMALEREKTSVDGKLAWTVPAGWVEKPATGMRMVTFKEAVAPDAIDVSIVTLGGMAGNVQANLARWAGQVGVSLDGSNMDSFIRQAEQLTTIDGIQTWLFDFSLLQQGADTATTNSIIASLIEMGESVVFVKMTGTIDNLKKNKEAFKSLTSSITAQ